MKWGVQMRPVKDLFFEEYWNIAYRKYTEEDSVVCAGDKKVKFDLLKATERYWYADPFLFDKDGKTYLFVEMFDNKTEVGSIGVSEYVNGKFTEPQIVLKESFHLSYPLVFEKDGKIFMMPETHEDNCIQLYEAVQFPTKWKKHSVIVNEVNAVDTVEENGLLIASVVCPQNDMSINLSIYNRNGGEMSYSPVYTHSFLKRGAGDCFTHNGVRMRPSQCCENGNYGGKIIFNKINMCDNDGYDEEQFSEITPKNIITDINAVPNGIHTYAENNEIEIVDIKYKRINLKRLYWIIKKKLG